MDAQLAQIYGTGQSVEDDQVKLAAAELLVKLAEDNGVDLNQFSDADVAQMVSELQKTAEFPPKESKETAESKESKESSESGEKAAEEKVAEADFLGRVMAHSFNQELGEIQKVAGPTGLGSLGEAAVSRAASAARGHAREGTKGAIKAFIGKRLESNKSGLSDLKNALTAGKSYSFGEKARGAARSLKKMPETAAGVGLAGAGGVAAATHKKEKKSSALDTLASERAWELAKEAGWVDTEGNLTVPQQEQKTASALEIEVGRRALQMLEAEGLPVQWNE